VAVVRTTFSLSCIDRYGNAAPFIVECLNWPQREGAPEAWEFRVRPEDASATTDFFMLTLERVSVHDGRVVAMSNHEEPGVSAKGIPDALLTAAARRLCLAIQSSPTKGEGAVFRTARATRVWQRLMARTLAAYDPHTDVFRLV